jgi:hypothetical protein
LENSWSKGKDVELQELILQTQSPPIEKLGAFDVETFFPTKERRELAVALNNFLAAPSFETWRTGESWMFKSCYSARMDIHGTVYFILPIYRTKSGCFL